MVITLRSALVSGVARKRAQTRTSPALRLSMAVHEPDFSQLLGAMHGFKPEQDKLIRSNVDNLSTYLFEDMFCGLHGEMDNWDDVLGLLYRRLAFFRAYFCAVDTTNAIGTGDVEVARRFEDREDNFLEGKSFAQYFDEKLMEDVVHQHKQGAAPS